ncbi:transmembrane protein, putative (macronuclear) [Tetrahymena thermophila SB210]|uniref:Transmembrane protein, putative n=1 Tax=Tetrahymena thermophila (strain SB210) TaxID=312017 RepID=Q23VD0_TETTS|nr:transmembrane protein, putative [Tetrahymena thermophila SB210]EAS00506.1 transmembrane protein, putative [Tetrahymena thermophila SB210]|eukprot:XP_001020751.1 transmembrane protein, putative [Tetrahymena thermophila SB210]
MRFCAFVLLALVAIAAAQQDATTENDKQAQIQECIDKIGKPCENGTTEEKQDCNLELGKLFNCLDKCFEENKENKNEIYICQKSKCKSENDDAQAFYDKKISCMNNGINILAFTVIASALALLL